MTHLASVDLIAPFRRYKLQRCLPSPEYNEGRWYLSGFTPKNQNKAKQNKTKKSQTSINHDLVTQI